MLCNGVQRAPRGEKPSVAPPALPPSWRPGRHGISPCFVPLGVSHGGVPRGQVQAGLRKEGLEWAREDRLPLLPGRAGPSSAKNTDAESPAPADRRPSTQTSVRESGSWRGKRKQLFVELPPRLGLI